ncbi:MAG: pectin acetylesterase-family hydrolase [Chitinophagales bacterium]
MKRFIFSLLVLLGMISCNKEVAIFKHPLKDIEAATKSFHWFDIDGMICRNGTPTGIGYRVGSPKKLAIYINGGGACFNEETCGSNPKSFNVNDWNDLSAAYSNKGIFDVDNPKNPLKDYSFVLVPYCTGDVHSGTRNTAFALGVADTQHYVGALNFKKAMDFIQPYFDYNNVEEVVLFGLSAGGYGVYVNFLEVTKRFPNAKITVINDSGPLFSDPQAFPICLQLGFTFIFGLPVPNDLLECCGTPGLGLSNVYQYSGEKYPNAHFGFISSYEDATSRFFLSFGYNNCTGAPNNQLPADIFRNAIVSLRENVLKPKSTWSTYLINGETHTLMADNEIFYNRNLSGMYLYEWVDRLIKGERMHISE